MYNSEEANRIAHISGVNVLKCMRCGKCSSKVIEAVRLMKIRQQGQNHLKPESIPEMLDEDLPQQAIVSAFRKYSK